MRSASFPVPVLRSLMGQEIVVLDSDLSFSTIKDQELYRQNKLQKKVVIVKEEKLVKFREHLEKQKAMQEYVVELKK